MKQEIESTVLHEVPPDYYERAIKTNPIQRIWHKFRFKNLCLLIEPTDGEILDIGSADGTLTEVIANKSGAKKIIGIDILESSVEYANKRFINDKRMEFVVVDAHELPFKNNKFEAIFCSNVLEHLHNPLKAVTEFRRILKPGGYLIISVPTENFLFKIAWWIVLHSWGKHWRETHVQDFGKMKNLKSLFEETALNIEVHKKFLLGMLQVVKVRK